MLQNNDDTFEKCLDDYRKMVLFHKRQLLEDAPRMGSDGKQIRPCSNADCMFKDSCYQICGVLKGIPDERINRFFDSIIKCFIEWIDSEYFAALNHFDEFLEDFNLAKDDGIPDELCLQDLEDRVFYRGRLNKQHLSRIDLYHVPFSKRYLIKSGRFSLAGRPLLYLCNSIIGVIEELEVDRGDLEQLRRLKVSSYEFLKNKRIYDLRCNIWHDLKNVRVCSFSTEKFYRNLLSIVCCFPKRQGVDESFFTEEYVIPQMLAQALKRKKYDGLCHYSTKPFSGLHYESHDSEFAYYAESIRSNDMRTMAYRENLVVFTNYKGKKRTRTEEFGAVEAERKADAGEVDPIDYDLYDELRISVPTGLLNTYEASEETLYKLFADISNRKQTTDMDKDVQKANKKAKLIFDFYQETFHVLMDREKKYCETAYGRIQTQLLAGIFNRLLIEGTSDWKGIKDGEANTVCE